MGKLHDTYKLTITTLSPLHIGTGNTLRQGYDYVTHRGQTWVFDADVLADMLYEHDPDEFEKMVQGVPASDLIRPDEYDPASPLFRYVLRGEPRSKGKGAELQEQLKDPWDRPYIPGSSLKGALRTALAYVGWQQRKLAFDLRDLNERGGPKFAALPMERKVLNADPAPRGQEPNHDLLRALQVSDSTPGEKENLQLLNVQVAVGDKAGSPIELEAIRRDVTFEAALTLDGFLCQQPVAKTLGWSADDQLKWLKVIPQVVNAFTVHRIDSERIRWGASSDPIRSFYETLYRLLGQLDKRSEFLLQLGWGGGWDSKTFGDVLTRDGKVFEQVVQKYGRTMVRQGKYKADDIYPKSRRVVVTSSGQPAFPLGWIKVRMEVCDERALHC
ncbi:MAG: type III-A CRISPR-associated RAMP protein Csm5 [Anaerolineae bacterium]|nr:type III-A CRISPR-associated RAMP protein Csm5 [Anaerolineae bacterium]